MQDVALEGGECGSARRLTGESSVRVLLQIIATLGEGECGLRYDLIERVRSSADALASVAVTQNVAGLVGRELDLPLGLAAVTASFVSRHVEV